MEEDELVLQEALAPAVHAGQVAPVLRLDLANGMLQDLELLALLHDLRLHSLSPMRLLLPLRQTPTRQLLTPCLVGPSARPCPAAPSV